MKEHIKSGERVITRIIGNYIWKKYTSRRKFGMKTIEIKIMKIEKNIG